MPLESVGFILSEGQGITSGRSRMILLRESKSRIVAAEAFLPSENNQERKYQMKQAFKLYIALMVGILVGLGLGDWLQIWLSK